MPRANLRKNTWRWLGAAALAAGVGLFLREREERLTERDAPAARTPITRVAPPSKPHPAPPLLIASDGMPVVPHDPSARPAPGPAHPHPITPSHTRIYRENQLISRLNGALDARDGARLRGLLETYRAEYPEDPHALQEGYEIIADCLEHPSPASAAVARTYYATETASTLRRYVRRLCW
jgi:hypothetical protein